MSTAAPVSLVTGGNRGIGRETARRLAGLGHTVLLSARRPEDAERAVAETAPGVSGTLVPCRLDVTDADSVRALARRVEAEFGRLDVLVDNAAVNYDTARRAVSVDQGATGVLWAATLPDSGATGGFFRDGGPLPW
ncbi:SDR family NAD(P)-dependent oxidoreductase [Streptomyces roseolus]|uniref:SDR family NAD(P)-dependent oxidoreductase n=1 Tax=Streptomyces roseolus TaxID=67358 RepID=UPI00364A0203